MAAHSPPGPAVINVPEDQPVSGWGEWLREMARALNLLAVRANTMPVDAANDAAAAALGVPVGGLYRTGSAVMVRVV